jgi:hypothetical protein
VSHESHESHDARACVRDIADLLAWCRRLTEQRAGNADPAEVAAYQQAKRQLLARLTHDTDTDMGEGEHR